MTTIEASTGAGTRMGGDVLAESLRALGTRVVFGLPGVHALPMWEGLRRIGMPTLATRTELCAGFAADGYARSTGQPAPLLLSTGPGALNSLTAMMEAASSHVPVVAIVSQIPREHIGRGRGFLHELPDQGACFAPIVKWVARAPSAEAIPALLAEAFRRARTAPSGPVMLEIPFDVLSDPTSVTVSGTLDGTALPSPPPSSDTLDEVARLLGEARRPVIWAGGGVQRSGAWDEVVALAESLQAPVATTYMGRGTIAAEHPLAVGSGCDEAAFQELLSEADLVLAVGTELGAETTGQYGLAFSGRLVQIDAAAERIGALYPARGIVADARQSVAGLRDRLAASPASNGNRGWGISAAAAVRGRIARGLAAQDRRPERAVLDVIGQALPAGSVNAWDMTIMGYWAAAHLPAAGPRRFLYPLGSGTLGYAWPAAIGASLAADSGAPALAVVGDGGLQYGLAELATAAQHRVRAALLIIDDGGYGILREYQDQAFGQRTAVELRSSLSATCEAAGMTTRTTTIDTLAADLEWALRSADGGDPAALVLPFTPRSAEFTA